MQTQQTQQQQTRKIGNIFIDPVSSQRFLIDTPDGLFYFRPANARTGAAIRTAVTQSQRGAVSAYVDAAYRVYAERDGRRVELGLALGWNRRPFDPLRPSQFGPITALSGTGRRTLYLQELTRAVYDAQTRGDQEAIAALLGVVPLLDAEFDVDGLQVTTESADPLKQQLASELTALATGTQPTDQAAALADILLDDLPL